MSALSKLAKLLGRLQSDQDGEVMAAVHKINEWIKADGRNWNEAISGSEPTAIDLRNRIMLLQSYARKFDEDDRKIFYEIKQKYLENRIQQCDMRKVDWLAAMARSLDEDDVPF